MSAVEICWLIVGFGGQLAFTSRFLVQWIASERKRESVIPLAFWYLSIVGGLMLLAYSIYRQDPVIISGQALGVVVYARNLFLIYRYRYGWFGGTKALATSDPPTRLTNYVVSDQQRPRIEPTVVAADEAVTEETPVRRAA